MIDLGRPLFTLTVGEWLQLQQNTTSAPSDAIKQKDGAGFIRGIHELSKFLGVSLGVAQELKNSGKLPYFQYGRVLFFDPEKVRAAINDTTVTIKKRRTAKAMTPKKNNDAQKVDG